MTKVTPPFYSSWDHVMLKHASWALLCSVTLSSLRLTPVGLSPISRLHLSHALRHARLLGHRVLTSRAPRNFPART